MRLPGLPFANAGLLVLLTSVVCGGEPDRIPVTGRDVPELKPFDDLLLSFMRENRVPGASVAVTRNGKLVYARGFGYADLDARTPVQPASLFRIASLSKPLTSAAVLQLVEQGKVKLDGKAFAFLGLTPPANGDARLKEITVLQLLQHTGGWDRNVSFDPMFRSLEICRVLDVPPPARPCDIIQYMLGQPLDLDPGTTCSYSNFGYCVLGRIVEKAGGQPYETYVREHVLAPLGIRAMRLGRTLEKDRAPGEVRYYDDRKRTGNAVMGESLGRPVPLPYGVWCLESMDAHGGWLASAADLVRFASAFDKPGKCPILNEESVKTLFARPAGNAGVEADGNPRAAYYGCGWMVRPVGGTTGNRWHLGGMDGTSSLLVCRHDGLCWAVLFNSRMTASDQDLAAAIDGPMHGAANAVKSWPDTDLFER